MKLKAIKDITTPFGTLKKDGVIDNISTKPNQISFKYKNATIDLPKEFEPDFLKVSDDTPVNYSFESSSLLKDIEKGASSFVKSIKLGGGIGLLGGIALATYRKSGVLGYLGWGLTLGAVGVLIGTVLGGEKAIKKAIE